ncbi:alanine:cation symporter family protein, partial [Yunchengibacter salinarum]|uniref:alanine:cation symporter family protein n=1 Tax=Yunchengibacter salinarum TaxID=3133399 RepID=UPI0035B58BC5
MQGFTLSQGARGLEEQGRGNRAADRPSLGRRIILALFAASLSVPALAQSGDEARGTVVQTLAALVNGLGDIVFYQITLFGVQVEWIVIWMLAPMLFLTAYFRFINLRGFRQAWRVLTGRYASTTDPGEVTQFQALSTALSGTVGLGNIAGVAVAIGMGGPGATFWMILIGLVAMSLKFAECTLGVKYRDIHADGTVSGGPMYYLHRGLAGRGLPRLGKGLAWAYALFALPALLQVAQVNQAYSQISGVTGIRGSGVAWGFGVVLAI